MADGECSVLNAWWMFPLHSVHVCEEADAWIARTTSGLWGPLLANREYVSQGERVLTRRYVYMCFRSGGQFIPHAGSSS